MRKEVLPQLWEELHPQSCQKQKELPGEVGSSLFLEVFEQMLENCLARTPESPQQPQECLRLVENCPDDELCSGDTLKETPAGEGEDRMLCLQVVRALGKPINGCVPALQRTSQGNIGNALTISVSPVKFTL